MLILMLQISFCKFIQSLHFFLNNTVDSLDFIRWKYHTVLKPKRITEYYKFEHLLL